MKPTTAAASATSCRCISGDLASDRQDRAEALFAEFPKMLDFYEAEVGPFPFGDEKMGVVETPHLGMEHQTINAYGNAYKLDGKGYDWLLQHELAHEWFGNQMTNRNLGRHVAARGAGLLHAAPLRPLAERRPLYGGRADDHAAGAAQHLPAGLGQAAGLRDVYTDDRPGPRPLQQGRAGRPFAADADRRRGLQTLGDPAGLWPPGPAPGQFRAALRHHPRLHPHRERGEPSRTWAGSSRPISIRPPCRSWR
jgi:hypothetical protein